MSQRPMETLEHSVEVDAPLSVTYNQWTQFEAFPRFMEGVESITQGTLRYNGSPVLPGQTLLSPGGQWTWMPPSITFGASEISRTIPAFTIVAFDGQVASQVPVQVR